MARIQKGILDGIRGRFGSLVGRKLGLLNIITAIPSNPKKNKTPGQIQNEQRMGYLRGLGSFVYSDVLLNLLNIGLRKTTVLSEFVSLNYPALLSYPIVDYSSLIFSNGVLLNTPIKSIANSEANQRVRFTWAQNWTTSSLRGDDLVVAVTINEISGEVAYSSLLSLRQDKKVDVPQLNLFNSDTIQCYLMFKQGTSYLTSSTNYKQKN